MAANSTIRGSLATGGTFRDISYVPACSNAVQFSAYSLSAAVAFDPKQASYYKNLWHLGLAGWICAGVVLVICLVFLIWLLCFCACSCCCGWHRLQQQREPTPGARPYGQPVGKTGRKRSGACSFLPILCIIAFIILLGVSSWALYEGIHNLGHVVSDAWVIAVNVRNKAALLNQSVVSFFTGLTGVQQALIALGTVLQGGNGNLPGNLNIGNNAAGSLISAASTLDGVIRSGQQVAAEIERYGVTSIDNFRVKYKPPSEKAQNVYVPAILGVMFSILVLLALLATALVVSAHIRIGGFFLLLYWIWVGIIIFIGPGLMHITEKVASDTCLYPERFAFQVVNTTGSLSATNKVAADAALSYYFGTDGNMTAEQVASQVYNVNLSAIMSLADTPGINSTFAYLGTPAGIATINSFASAGGSRLNSTGQASLTAGPAALNQTYKAFDVVLANIQRSNFEQIYGNVKNLLCCEISNTSRLLWISWTITGTVAAVLGLLLLLRVFLAARHYGRSIPEGRQQFIAPQSRNAPFLTPPMVPAQAATLAPQPVSRPQAAVPQSSSYGALNERMRATYGNGAGPSTRPNGSMV